MVDNASTEQLDRIEREIAKYPDGAGFAALVRDVPEVSKRTMNRRLRVLIETGRVERRGQGRGVVYLPVGRKHTSLLRPLPLSEFETPDGIVQIELSSVSRNILEYVSRPISARSHIGYEPGFLEEYKPNRTSYLSESIKVHLHSIGRPINTDRAGGTFARDILSRLLIDLSWSSSRLEGNTYSRLDTERLIEFGQAAEGKDAKETQMILNHKAAIELLLDEHDDIGINRFTLLNLHAVLSEELMADPEASGRLRRRPVEIGKSVYVPPAVPQVVEERFNFLIRQAAAIQDPFEQAFFIMVQLPYLQPFEDVNKRVSRLAANIPLFRQNMCPLSFVEVPERAYILGTLGVYEMRRMELLRDVFVWAYERSCQKYVVVRDSLVEPDLFRMKYRSALAAVISEIVRDRVEPSDIEIRRRARSLVDAASVDKFTTLAKNEFARLYEGNISRYRIRLSEFSAWRKVVPERSTRR